MTSKKTKGRQKIEMKKIENEEDKMITFSKRRSGIYKKISELSTLCGVEVGFLAFTGAGNPFTFGCPSFESTAKQFINEDYPKNNNNSSSLRRVIVDAHKKVTINELNRQHSRLVEELEIEKERTKALTSLMSLEETEETEWWRIDPDEVHEEATLKPLIAKYAELHYHVCRLVVQTSRERALPSHQWNFPGFINVEDAKFSV